MRRFLLISLAIIVALLAILLGVVVWLINDEEFLKEQINKYSVEYTGRELTVDGMLDLSLGSVIRLEAAGIHFANADWADKEDMVHIGQLVASVKTFSLLGDKPLIPIIQITDCQLELLETVENGANWDMGSSEEEEEPDAQGLPVDILHLDINDCEFTYDSEADEQSHEILVDRFRQELMTDDRWEAQGAATLNGEKLDLAGWFGPAGVFYNGGRFEHELTVTWGGLQLDSSGSIEDLYEGAGANIKTNLTGPALENVLERLDLPPVSSGPFDFHLSLDSTGSMTQLAVNGNLGAFDIIASGKADSITEPGTGFLDLDLKGESLQRLGDLLNIQGLVDDAFRLQLQAGFQPGQVDIKSSNLSAGLDAFSVQGELHRENHMAGTALEFELNSPEIGRWAPALGQASVAVGPLYAKGTLNADEQGIFSTAMQLEQAPSQLKLEGILGRLDEDLAPRLQIEFSTSDIQPLASLAGYPEFPAVPVKLEGGINRDGDTVELEQLFLDFNGDHAHINGQVQLEKRLAGSNVEAALDIADLATLGALFGQHNLPGEPLKLTAEIRPEGKGLRFTLDNKEAQNLRLKMNAHVPDIEQPTALDATFDFALPSLAILQALVPDQALPDLPVAAAGQLHNDPSETRLHEVQGSLGELVAAVDGSLTHDGSYDLSVRAHVPDASMFDSLVGSMPPVPATFTGRIHGSAQAVNLPGLKATLGDSDVAGDLQISLSDRLVINGDLKSKLLDITHWTLVEDEPEEPEPRGDMVFTNDPILNLADMGFDLVLSLNADKFNLPNTQLSELSFQASLDANYARINQFSFKSLQGSQVRGNFEMDQSGTVPRLRLSFAGEGIKIGLMSGEDQDVSTIPLTDIHLDLSGQGNTQHELASSLNGKARVYSGPGKLASSGISLLFSDFLTELFKTLNPFAEDSPYTSLECTVAAADVKDGIVELGPIVFNTEELSIFSMGTIDLHTEKININFNTKPKKGLGISAGVLINPLTKVGGTLASPSIELDPKGTVVSGGVAVATGGLSLLAKSFSDRFLASKDPCGDAREEIEERDSAMGSN